MVLDIDCVIYEQSKKIADMRRISYVYLLLWRFGVIQVPDFLLVLQPTIGCPHGVEKIGSRKNRVNVQRHVVADKLCVGEILLRGKSDGKARPF